MSGPSEETGRERIYVGEGDPVGPRLYDHTSKKDFWTQAYFFITKDENLNKAHIQYLEARLYELATAAKRVELDNANKPAHPSLSEADTAEMEAFLADMLVCFPVLGLSAFESPTQRVTSSRMFVAKGPRGEASGFESDDGFVVHSGAIVSPTEAGATPAYVSTLRVQLVNSGLIDTTGEKWKLIQDYVFSSPSTAAAVVLGRNANGRVEWKDQAGRTLKQVQEAEA